MSLIEATARRKSHSQRPIIVLGLLWLLLALITIITQLLQPAPITVEWRTETEINAAGFNIYRATAEDGPYTKVNDRLMAGKGSPSSGAVYTFVDDSVRPGVTYYYRLEDVELDNSTVQHPPITYSAPLTPWWVPIMVVLSLLFGLFLLSKGLRAERNP